MMKVIVVGSGVVGASAAYQLAKNNVEVFTVDKEHKGNATAAGAGIVSPWLSTRGDHWYEIAKRGARFYPALISDLKADGETNVGYKKVGSLYVSKDESELVEMENELHRKKEDAPEVEDIIKLSPEKAKELFPPLHEDFGAIFVSGAARVDGRLLRNALKRAATKHGATLIHGEAELIYRNDKVTGVKVNGEVIEADQVIVAAGAWAPDLLAPLGIHLQIEPQRGQIAHIKLPDVDTSNWPVVSPRTSHYMLAFDDSRVVAGATRENGSGFDYRLTASGVHEVLSEALSVAPGLNEGTLQEVRIGFRPMGSDLSPIIGKVDSVEGMVLANGLGPSGLTMGPFVGKLAAMLATGEEIDFSLEPYNPKRSIEMETVKK